MRVAHSHTLLLLRLARPGQGDLAAAPAVQGGHADQAGHAVGTLLVAGGYRVHADSVALTPSLPTAALQRLACGSLGE